MAPNFESSLTVNQSISDVIKIKESLLEFGKLLQDKDASIAEIVVVLDELQIKLELLSNQYSKSDADNTFNAIKTIEYIQWLYERIEPLIRWLIDTN